MHIDTAQTIKPLSNSRNLHHAVSALRGAYRQEMQVSVAARLIDGSAPPKAAPATDGHISVRA